MRRNRLLLLLALASALLSGCALVNAPDPSVTASRPVAQTIYDDQVIQLIVPFAQGGGTDTWARTLAPLLQKELGRNVRVQVTNRPGASGISGTNSFARNHNANTILVSSGSVFFPYLLGDRSVEYDFNDFVPILGSSLGGVVYVSADTGIRSVTDLCEGNHQLRYAGISAAGSDIVSLLTFELLGLGVDSTFGYDGKGAARVSLEQGETNIDYQTSPAYLANVQPLVDSGRAIPLYSFGILNNQGEVERDPAFPDLMTIKDAYNICFGSDPSGVAWDVYKATLAAGFTIQKIMWVHEDTPEEAITILRQAADIALNNPETFESAQNLLGNYNFFIGHEAQVTFAAASSLSPESISWLKALLRDKYGVRF